MTEQDLIHKIEWVNKRCSLKGEPLTQSQIELLKFVFADTVVNKNFALGKVNWIPISEIKNIKPENNILIWQENLCDKECSRFQRAVWYEDSHINVYPLSNKTMFKYKNGFYEGYDLEGDLCIVTHFTIINAPS